MKLLYPAIYPKMPYQAKTSFLIDGIDRYWNLFIIIFMIARFFANWTRQARKGFLELAVLNEIHNRRMYGYEIERKFRKSIGPLLSGGTIYSILKRLKFNQLVKTTVTKSPDGPKRKYYQLTPKGRQTLAQMNTYWQAIKQQADFAKKSK